ncbi:MAG: hypothetical protein WC506_02255 [Candidatus Micrarchaeia archaeon]
MGQIGEAWDKTCKILLGGEVGPLAQFEGQLMRYVTPLSIEKSALSGVDVAVPGGVFCKGAKFISNSEAAGAPMVSQSKPLDINDLKDLDSIVGALEGRVFYSGNIVLGNSKNVGLSDRCINSSNVLSSSDIYDSEYVAYSSILRYMKYAFGCDNVAESAFIVGGYNITHATRFFEANQTFYSSDCYYVANLEGCNECMFSFNLRNASYRIGNLALPKDKYDKLKAKLLEDLRQTLSSKKRAPRIIDFLAVPKGKVALPGGAKNAGLQSSSEQVSRKEAMDRIEQAFSDTCGLVLGKPLSPLLDYAKWLQRHVLQPRRAKSAASGLDMIVPGWHSFKTVNDFVGFEESLELGKQALSSKEVESLSISNSVGAFARLSITSPWFYRKSMGMVDVAISREAQYCYWGSLYVFSRHCAYSHWPRNSEYAFGCNLVFSSKFCIKCHDSSNLSRCFEVSDSNNCSDCCFCHNCEGLQECMFCFNTKNKKHAVFNVEIGRDRYLALKKAVLSSICARLEREKSLGLDIFCAGCASSHKKGASPHGTAGGPGPKAMARPSKK